MNTRVQRASLLTLAFTFIAVWIAFVNAGPEMQPVEWPLPWLPPLAATVLLIGAMFLAGLLVFSDRELRAFADSSRAQTGLQMLVAALVFVAALLGLVHALKAALWGGPDWQRWAIIGLVTATVVAGSGRAMGCGLLGGLAWGVLGLLIGLNKALPEMVDLLLIGVLVGTTIGAVAGTILKAGRRSRGQNDI